MELGPAAPVPAVSRPPLTAECTTLELIPVPQVDGTTAPMLRLGNQVVSAFLVLNDDGIDQLIAALSAAKRDRSGFVVAGADELPRPVNGRRT